MLSVGLDKSKLENQRNYLAWVCPICILYACLHYSLHAMFVIYFIMIMYLSIHRENRYLLFLTENYAALRILHHYLHDAVHISPSKQTDEQADTLNLAHLEPFVLFGSSFPRDKEYTQVC